VWRTALRPRWLALLAVVLLAATGMARLGQWQLQRAHDLGGAQEHARAGRAPVPLTSLLTPQHAFAPQAADRRVEVSGRWDPAGQLLVAGRLQHGASGWWVLTPLVLDGGAAVPVVRGWTASPSAVPVPAGGPSSAEVRVTGLLLPGEDAVDRAPGQASGLPAGQLDRVDPAELVQRWSYPIYTGFVVAAGGTAGLAEVTVDTSGGLALQNLSYAVQWWLFAAFGLFFWWRLVRDDHRGVLSPAGPAPPAAATPTAVGNHGS
jgi:cytochrome oxidase assembly protein ShyY1